MTAIALHTLARSWTPRSPLGQQQLEHQGLAEAALLVTTSLGAAGFKQDHPRPALPEVAKEPLVNHFQSYSKSQRAGTQKGLPPQESLALPTG